MWFSELDEVQPGQCGQAGLWESRVGAEGRFPHSGEERGRVGRTEGRQAPWAWRGGCSEETSVCPSVGFTKRNARANAEPEGAVLTTSL